jgi:hypothetical protein
VAVAAVLAAVTVSGGCGVVVRRAAPKPSVSVDTARLAELAVAALPAAKTSPVYEFHGPVQKSRGWISSNPGGVATLRAACAGAGSITLVLGGVPYDEAGGGPTVIRDLTVPCISAPEPVAFEFETSPSVENLTYEVTDDKFATGWSGFTFRLDKGPSGE